MDIRPASDLKYKFSEVENLAVNEDEVIYLTKNGYGSMVLMSLEKYTKMLGKKDLEEKMEEEFGNIDIEKVLDEIDEEIANKDIKYLTHEEVFKKLRRKANGK